MKGKGHYNFHFNYINYKNKLNIRKNLRIYKCIYKNIRPESWIHVKKLSLIFYTVGNYKVPYALYTRCARHLLCKSPIKIIYAVIMEDTHRVQASTLIRWFFSTVMPIVIGESTDCYREGYFASGYLAFPRATIERPHVRNLQRVNTRVTVPMCVHKSDIHTYICRRRR